MHTMSSTLHRTAHITVGLPPEQAMALFTPEGERRWAHGWDPHYPDPGRRQGSGAVFTTGHDGHHTTWIMVDHRTKSIRYARVVDGMTAGTIAIDVLHSGEDATEVAVTYDLTALTTAGETWLKAFDADYDSEMTAWSSAIAAALGPRT
jgi:hypothetical protein